MTITDRVQTDLAAAVKAQDKERLAALRLILDALKKEAKEVRAELDEAAEIQVLRRERKRRAEAADAYRQGGREDLAASEEAEAAVIDAYMPAELSDEELAALIGDALAETGATTPQEMGQVMKAVMPKVQGRADGKRVSALVREKLGA